MKTAHVEIRSQKSVGDRPGQWGGPDTYVMVQVVPDGVLKLKALNSKVAGIRGIELISCGEGYSRNRGPRSTLGRALATAEATAAEINGH